MSVQVSPNSTCSGTLLELRHRFLESLAAAGETERNIAAHGLGVDRFAEFLAPRPPEDARSGDLENFLSYLSELGVTAESLKTYRTVVHHWTAYLADQRARGEAAPARPARSNNEETAEAPMDERPASPIVAAFTEQGIEADANCSSLLLSGLRPTSTPQAAGRKSAPGAVPVCEPEPTTPMMPTVTPQFVESAQPPTGFGAATPGLSAETDEGVPAAESVQAAFEPLDPEPPAASAAAFEPLDPEPPAASAAAFEPLDSEPSAASAAAFEPLDPEPQATGAAAFEPLDPEPQATGAAAFEPLDPEPQRLGGSSFEALDPEPQAADGAAFEALDPDPPAADGAAFEPLDPEPPAASAAGFEPLDPEPPAASAAGFEPLDPEPSPASAPTFEALESGPPSQAPPGFASIDAAPSPGFASFDEAAPSDEASAFEAPAPDASSLSSPSFQAPPEEVPSFDAPSFGSPQPDVAPAAVPDGGADPGLASPQEDEESVSVPAFGDISQSLVDRPTLPEESAAAEGRDKAKLQAPPLPLLEQAPAAEMPGDTQFEGNSASIPIGDGQKSAPPTLGDSTLVGGGPLGERPSMLDPTGGEMQTQPGTGKWGLRRPQGERSDLTLDAMITLAISGELEATDLVRKPSGEWVSAGDLRPLRRALGIEGGKDNPARQVRSDLALGRAAAGMVIAGLGSGLIWWFATLAIGIELVPLAILGGLLGGVGARAAARRPAPKVGLIGAAAAPMSVLVGRYLVFETVSSGVVLEGLQDVGGFGSFMGSSLGTTQLVCLGLGALAGYLMGSMRGH